MVFNKGLCARVRGWRTIPEKVQKKSALLMCRDTHFWKFYIVDWLQKPGTMLKTMNWKMANSSDSRGFHVNLFKLAKSIRVILWMTLLVENTLYWCTTNKNYFFFFQSQTWGIHLNCAGKNTQNRGKSRKWYIKRDNKQWNKWVKWIATETTNWFFESPFCRMVIIEQALHHIIYIRKQ